MFSADFSRNVDARHRLADQFVVARALRFNFAAYFAVEGESAKQLDIGHLVLGVAVRAYDALLDRERLDRHT